MRGEIYNDLQQKLKGLVGDPNVLKLGTEKRTSYGILRASIKAILPGSIQLGVCAPQVEQGPHRALLLLVGYHVGLLHSSYLVIYYNSKIYKRSSRIHFYGHI